MAGHQNLIEGGMSSAAKRRMEAQQERKLQKEREAAAIVAPSVQVMLDWIDEELSQVCDLRHMVIHAADKELARDELIARKLHLDFLEKLKSRAQKQLRVAERADKKAKAENARKIAQYEKEVAADA